jgi:hypothetical protein
MKSVARKGGKEENIAATVAAIGAIQPTRPATRTTDLSGSLWCQQRALRPFVEWCQRLAGRCNQNYAFPYFFFGASNFTK